MKRSPLVLLGFLLAAILAECVLRLFPVSTGYDFGAVNAADPVLRGTPSFPYTYSKDWSLHLHNSGVLNNYGFRASFDYVPDPRALAVIGNSFVQADAIDPREAMTERLGRLLHRPAYAVGADGFSLADYLAATRWAGDALDVRTVVVLLTTGDLSHSCSPWPGKHHLRLVDGAMMLSLTDRSAPSRAKRLLNDSRLFRYVFADLQVTATWSKGWRRNDEEGPQDPDSVGSTQGCTDPKFEKAATQFLLTSFREFEAAHEARVIFVLAPGYRREQHQAAGYTRDVDRFALRAAQEGFAVVHLEAEFAEALRSNVRLDFLPIDGHWTAAANAIAARQVADSLAN
jgi:hypothetical protein